MEMNQDHRTLLMCNSTKLDSTANATTSATQRIMKLNDDFSSMMPLINNIAHGVVPKISSVKDAVKKTASNVRNRSRNREYKIRYYNQNLHTAWHIFDTYIWKCWSLLQKCADIKRSFSKCFPKKQMLYAFGITRGHIHVEFESGEVSKEIEMEWQPSFLGSKTLCRQPRTSKKNHSVLIKDVPKAEDFTDLKLTTLLEEKFSGAEAGTFIKNVLNTVKMTFQAKKTRKKTLSEGLFLNDHYFRAHEYSEEQKVLIIRCYNWQAFGHVAKTCKSTAKQRPQMR